MAAAVAVIMSVPQASAGGPPFLVASEFAVGGSGPDRLTDLVVDAAGNAYVSGVIGSYNFPGIDSAKYTNGGRDQRFVAKFPPLARTAAFVAVVGPPVADVRAALGDGFAEDEAAGLALDANGDAFLVAYDGGKDFPTAGGKFVESTGRKYVFKIAAAGLVSKHSIALDAAINRVGAIALDTAGAIYLTGSAREGLPTTPGAPYPTASTAAGCVAPFLMKLDPSGHSVVYATYLGASGTGGHVCGGKVPGQKIGGLALHPTGFAIALDAAGNTYVAGQAAPGLPATPGALDLGTKIPGTYVYNNLIKDPALHAFVTKINPAGSIVYTARIGGSLRDRATSIVVDGTGSAVIAGKTVSPDFPRTAHAVPGFPSVYMSCLLWTPEVGFLTRLSADGRQIVFSGFLALEGTQLDDCHGGGGFNPARLATDSSGNLYVAGATQPGNRYFRASGNAIIPDQSTAGGQLLEIYSADGRQRLYSTALGQYGVQGIGIDPRGGVIIAGDREVQRLAVGTLPVEIKLPPTAACAIQPFALSAIVAASSSLGTVDFSSDGTTVGSAPVVDGVATKVVTIGAAGVRKLKATYRGDGPFDGYFSPETGLPVNQPGTCP